MDAWCIAGELVGGALLSTFSISDYVTRSVLLYKFFLSLRIDLQLTIADLSTVGLLTQRERDYPTKSHGATWCASMSKIQYVTAITQELVR